MSFEKELKNWERYFQSNKQVGHTYSALTGVNNNKSARIVIVNSQQQELFPKQKSILFGADISGKNNPVVFDNYTILRLIQKSLYERIDKAKVVEATMIYNSTPNLCIDPLVHQKAFQKLLKDLGLK